MVKNIKLYDPNNGNVSYSDPSFDFWPEFFFKNYDADNGTWVDGGYSMVSGYGSTISDSLIAGTYRLVVTTNDEQTHERTFEFTQNISLPVIASSSFQLHPDVNGNVVCRTIKRNPSFAKTHIIIVSGVVNESEIKDLLSAGAEAFVKKPFNIVKLVDKVVGVLEMQ